MTEAMKDFQEKLPDFLKDIWTNTMETMTKAEADVKGFVGGLIDTGKLNPEEGRKLVKDMVTRFQDSRDKFENRASETYARSLHMINLPSKSEVDNLSKRVTSLTRKVNKLKKDLTIA